MYKPPKPFEKIDPDSTNPKNPRFYQAHDHNKKPDKKIPKGVHTVLDTVITVPVEHSHPEDMDKLDRKENLTPEKLEHLEKLDKGLKTLTTAFQLIQEETAERLRKINETIWERQENGLEPTQEKAWAEWKSKYNGAVDGFNNLVTKLNTQDLDDDEFKGIQKTINWIVIDPVMEGDLYVGVKIIARWLGGTHSDSSGIAINHPPP